MTDKSLNLFDECRVFQIAVRGGGWGSGGVKSPPMGWGIGYITGGVTR